jgi:hypothetical protein
MAGTTASAGTRLLRERWGGSLGFVSPHHLQQEADMCRPVTMGAFITQKVCTFWETMTHPVGSSYEPTKVPYVGESNIKVLITWRRGAFVAVVQFHGVKWNAPHPRCVPHWPAASFVRLR